MRGFKKFFAARNNPSARLTPWMSGALDCVSVSCLKSAARNDHEVHPNSDGDIPNIAKGVTHKDARSIIPEDEIFLYDGIELPSLFGPVASTYFARQRGVLHDVLPNPHYRPLFFREIEHLGERYEDFCASLPQETKAIHICNSAFKHAFKTHRPQGSFAARLKEESLDE